MILVKFKRTNLLTVINIAINNWPVKSPVFDIDLSEFYMLSLTATILLSVFSSLLYESPFITLIYPLLLTSTASSELLVVTSENLLPHHSLTDQSEG